MPVCNGRGDGGDHCCYIGGKICQFLVRVNGLPRCSLWPYTERLLDVAEWRTAPVGLMFNGRWPGKDCKDWPQNIPSEMERGTGLCCWNEVANGNVG